MVREPGADREAGFDDRSQLAGGLDARVVPVEVEAERIVDGDRPGSAEARRPADPRIGREPVDLLDPEARILDRVETGIQGELERITIEAPPDLRLPEGR